MWVLCIWLVCLGMCGFIWEISQRSLIGEVIFFVHMVVNHWTSLPWTKNTGITTSKTMTIYIYILCLFLLLCLHTYDMHQYSTHIICISLCV